MQEIPKSVIIKKVANIRWGSLDITKLLKVYNILFDANVAIKKEPQ
jgi:hypothetical protein